MGYKPRLIVVQRLMLHSRLIGPRKAWLGLGFGDVHLLELKSEVHFEP